MRVVFAVRASVPDMEHPDLPRGIPVELALPWRLFDFLEQMEKLPELERYVIENRIDVRSLHAPQGRLSDDTAAFLFWALPVVRFAKVLGVRLVVFHPNRIRKSKGAGLRDAALANLRHLRREAGDIAIGIETFSAQRVLTPEDVVQLKLPLVIDVSHIDVTRTMALIDAYHQGIVGIHLSEVAWYEQFGKKHTHMPAGRICDAVLKRLNEAAWSGIITLEYLHEFHEQMYADRQRLEAVWNTDR